MFKMVYWKDKDSKSDLVYCQKTKRPQKVMDSYTIALTPNSDFSSSITPLTSPPFSLDQPSEILVAACREGHFID